MLNNQIKYLLIFIAKNIPLKSKPSDLHCPCCNAPHYYIYDNTVGLCITYLVNCGLSTRKTRDIMKDVHGVTISHTQIANFATTVAYVVKPFVDSFDYNPTNYLSADETYTKVKGVKNYVWFIMDAIKKSILGYRSS